MNTSTPLKQNTLIQNLFDYAGDSRSVFRQLIQNLIVFSAVIFAQHLLDFSTLGLSIFAYCMVSWLSIVVLVTSNYATHFWQGLPTRLGQRVKSPWITMLVIIAISLLVAFIVNPLFGLFCLVYVAISLLHDLFLINVVLLDVIFLGVEFTVKATIGAVIINVTTSPWLQLCTFLAALVVALGKRRNELSMSSGNLPREVLEYYSLKLIDQMLAVVTSSAFIAYALYTISEHAQKDFGTTNLIYTQPLVLYGILRYLYLSHKADLKDGSELALMRDPPMMINLALWLGIVISVIYVFK